MILSLILSTCPAWRSVLILSILRVSIHVVLPGGSFPWVLCSSMSWRVPDKDFFPMPTTGCTVDSVLSILQIAIAASPTIVVSLHCEADLMANLLQELQVARMMMSKRGINPIQSRRGCRLLAGLCKPPNTPCNCPVPPQSTPQRRVRRSPRKQ